MFSFALLQYDYFLMIPNIVCGSHILVHNLNACEMFWLFVFQYSVTSTALSHSRYCFYGECQTVRVCKSQRGRDLNSFISIIMSSVRLWL